MAALEVSYVRLGPYGPSAADVCVAVSDSSLCKQLVSRLRWDAARPPAARPAAVCWWEPQPAGPKGPRRFGKCRSRTLGLRDTEEA